jgi:tetratricopeptide (TPR) repeat protein
MSRPSGLRRTWLEYFSVASLYTGCHSYLRYSVTGIVTPCFSIYCRVGFSTSAYLSVLSWLTTVPTGGSSARRLCTQATILDANYAAAYMCLSETYKNARDYGWEVEPQAVDRSFAFAQRAVASDDFSPYAHMALGDAYKLRKQLDSAIAEGQRSIALGPSCASCYGELAEHMRCVGRYEQALELLDKTLRLDPYRYEYQFDTAWVHSLQGRRDQAVGELKQVLIQHPDFYPAHGFLAVLYADAGKEDEARVEAAKWLTLVTRLTVPEMRDHWRQVDDACVSWKNGADSHFFDTLQRLVGNQQHRRGVG